MGPQPPKKSAIACPFGSNRHACECDAMGRSRAACPYESAKAVSKRAPGDEVERMNAVGQSEVSP